MYAFRHVSPPTIYLIPTLRHDIAKFSLSEKSLTLDDPHTGHGSLLHDNSYLWSLLHYNLDSRS